MAGNIVQFILSTSLFLVNGAILKHEDTPLNRVVRSPHCYECEGGYGPPPPPPPFFHHPRFHAHQWSGLARSPDGSQQQVFSGAAAAADSGLPSAGDTEAFSIASSSAGGAEGSGSGYKKSQYHGSGGSNQLESHGSGASSAGAGRYGSGNEQQQQQLDGSSGSSRKAVENLGTGNSNSQSSSSAYNSNGNEGNQQNQLGELHRGHKNGGLRSEDDQQKVQIGGTFDKQNLQQNSQNLHSGSFGDSSNDGSLQQQQRGNHREFSSNSGYSPRGDIGSSDGPRRDNNAAASSSSFAQRENEQQQIQNSGFGHNSASPAHNGRGDQGQRQTGFGKDAGVENTAYSGNQQQQTQFGGPSAGGLSGRGQQQLQNSGHNSWEYVSRDSSFGRATGHNGNEQERLQNAGQVSLEHGTHSGNGFSGGALNGHGGNDQQQLQNAGQGSWERGSSSGTSGGYGRPRSSYGETQSSLSGALNLASDGLKGSQDLQDSQKPACSTCDKSSLAYSNAKSHSGSAIALSIGG